MAKQTSEAADLPGLLGPLKGPVNIPAGSQRPADSADVTAVAALRHMHHEVGARHTRHLQRVWVHILALSYASFNCDES